jgi:II/X family phage/plasmid replication protein
MMIDLLKIAIPFTDEHLIKCAGHDHMSGVYINLEEVAKISGVVLSARGVEYDIDGDLQVTGLTHPFDSLPSHWSGVAMKIFPGGRTRHPCVELKASPAKILQGHNVFGTTDLALCAEELLGVLATAMPGLFNMLDIAETSLDWIDATFFGRVSNSEVAKQVIGYLKNVSNKQTKASRQSNQHETTVNWNKGSRHRELKAYLKEFEFDRELSELRRNLPNEFKMDNLNESRRMLARRLAVMSNPKLHAWLSGMVRFEARLKQRWLMDFGLPYRLYEAIDYQREYEKDGRNLISDMWSASFKDLFACLEGQTMNIHDDDQIFDSLKAAFFTVTPKGNISYSKANRLFGFYRRLTNEGYETVYRSMARQTFHDQIKCLIEIGLSKAQMQNLVSGGSNVVPLLQVINIDFSNQRPGWYQEPVSQFAALRPNNVISIQGRAA